MGGKPGQIGVIESANDLIPKYGDDAIEIFTKEKQAHTTFTIDGKNYSWDEIELDFKTGSYTRDRVTGYIPNSEVPNTLMYKANKQWAEKLVDQKFTIYDIGNPNGLVPSLFYDLELNTIFN
jgi:hypothetical protein